MSNEASPTDLDAFLTFRQAAKLLPPVGLDDEGKPIYVCHTALWRWTKRGSNGILLAHYKLGRRKYTTRRALMEFGRLSAEAALSPPPPAPPAGPPRVSPQGEPVQHLRERAPSVGDETPPPKTTGRVRFPREGE